LCSNRQSRNAVRRDWINELRVEKIIDIVLNKTPLKNCHFTWIITNIHSTDTLGPCKGPPILIDIEENQDLDE
jgi:hypothetical protein